MPDTAMQIDKNRDDISELTAMMRAQIEINKTAGEHGDWLQMQNGGTVRQIFVINCTICTGYQAFMMVGDGTHGLVEKLTFINTNVRDIPNPQQPMSVAFELQISSKSAVVEFINTYCDWPDAGHILATYPGLQVLGEIQHGVPPGGDFCEI